MFDGFDRPGSHSDHRGDSQSGFNGDFVRTHGFHPITSGQTGVSLAIGAALGTISTLGAVVLNAAVLAPA